MALSDAYAHESGSLMVNSPKSLADMYKARNGTIGQRPAMFGIPAHGHQAQMTGRVVYVPSDDFEGCEPINKAELPDMSDMGLVIMVVERGNCTFVTKVKHAQEVGASGCVIVDNQDEKTLPYMADDGFGSVISIPAMLIHRDDGANIDATVNEEGQAVMLTMAWNTPHPDNIVEWQMWTSADDTVVSALKAEISKFKAEFDEVAGVLGDSAVLTPHYFIGNGEWNSCVQKNDNKPLRCGSSCTNQGRYCSFNARADIQNGITGAQVIEENLRQICVFRLLNETGSATKWWNYVENFMNNCKDFSITCSEGVLAAPDVGLTAAAVNKCMDDAGGVGERSGINSILEEEMKMRVDLNVWHVPAILVNGQPYTGGLTCPQPIDVTHCGVLATICMGFLDQSTIPACTSSPGCQLGQAKDLCGKCGGNGEIDACGECNQLDGQNFNSSCLGCDDVANSGTKMDSCGVCGGPGPDACKTCHPLGQESPDWVGDESTCLSKDKAVQEAAAAAATGIDPVTTGVIVGVVVLVLAIGVFAYVRHRQRLFKDDVDALLAQYLPMADGVGNVNKGGAISTA